jgi:hypothetical protein
MALGVTPILAVILTVLLVSAPGQVRERVVSRIAVEVARLHSFGTRPDKSLKDQAMNAASDRLSIASQIQVVIAPSRRSRFLHALLHPTPLVSKNRSRTWTPTTPDAAVIADAIAGESLKKSILNTIALSHDVSFRMKDALG